jgi:hypothetical protein
LSDQDCTGSSDQNSINKSDQESTSRSDRIAKVNEMSYLVDERSIPVNDRTALVDAIRTAQLYLSVLNK